MSTRNDLLSVIPPRTVGSLARWVFHAIPPGGFVTNVLEGNLFRAIAHADEDNRRNLVPIAQLISWYIPGACWGSPEAVREWRKVEYKYDRDTILVADPNLAWLKDYLNA